MQKQGNNYAFIDTQNLIMGIKEMGWRIDWKKFRVYLREKYSVTTAYAFMGYRKEYEAFYRTLRMYGYTLCFKTVVRNKDGTVKGNIDVNMTLQIMVDYHLFDKAIIISSDGDFECLAKYLIDKHKLKIVLSAHRTLCSFLLKSASRGRIYFIDDIRHYLEYKKRAVLHRDGTLHDTAP